MFNNDIKMVKKKDGTKQIIMLKSIKSIIVHLFIIMTSYDSFFFFGNFIDKQVKHACYYHLYTHSNKRPRTHSVLKESMLQSL